MLWGRDVLVTGYLFWHHLAFVLNLGSLRIFAIFKMAKFENFKISCCSPQLFIYVALLKFRGKDNTCTHVRKFQSTPIM